MWYRLIIRFSIYRNGMEKRGNVMADLLYIYPDFLMRFRCIGSKCMNTCCEGWDVRVDEDTAEYYEHLEGAFGDFLRQHVLRDEMTNKITAIKMEDNHCPFLNEEGLCKIQLECGAEHLGKVCQDYPRYEHGGKNVSLIVVLTSCDAVMDILYNQTKPIRLCTAGQKGVEFSETIDYKALELSHLISWGMELLQDESVPFGMALATVLYVEQECEIPFESNDFMKVDSILLQAPEIQAQFLQTKKELDPDETEKAAWRFILGVLDAFCLIISQNIRDPRLEKLLWKSEMSVWSDEVKRSYIFSRWQECRKSRRHMSFMRRLSAVCLLYYSSGFLASQFITSMCIRMILFEILPLTWEGMEDLGGREYLARLSFLSRWFEQKSILDDSLQKVLNDVFTPDFYTYVIALMELFG